MPVFELFEVGSAILLVIEKFDLLMVKLQGDLVIDVEIFKVWRRDHAAFEIVPHALVKLFQRMYEFRCIEQKICVASCGKPSVQRFDACRITPISDSPRHVIVRARANQLFEIDRL